ncbi:hypothetical protein [Tenuifilum osseticum]|uniref:hypothetical protein n=1 Tax=Tenuifilum osseticum TaxID=3374723 RepID=UPI0034E5912F
MKRLKSISIAIIGVTCLLLLVLIASRAQNANSCSKPMNTQLPSSDLGQIKHIAIQGSDVTIIGPNGGQLNFRKQRNTTDLTPIFGKPDRITDFYAEMESEWWKKWEYPGAKFYIIPNKMFDSFEIGGPGFKLNVKGTILEVGKPIDELAKAFPDFKNYIIKNRTVSFAFQMADGKLSDEFMGITFDPVTRNITSMYNGMP